MYLYERKRYFNILLDSNSYIVIYDILERDKVMYNENERRPRNGAVISVFCESVEIVYDARIGEVVKRHTGNGILRLYADVRRLEFKHIGDDMDGIIEAFPLDLVRSWTYKPQVQRVEF